MKTPLTLVVWIVVLLTGCTGMSADYNDHSYMPGQTTPQLLSNGRRLESVPVADHPCDPANVYFIDEPKGIRQVVIDWNKMITYTMQRKGHDDLVKHIQKAGQACPMPTLTESHHRETFDRSNNWHFDSYAFMRYRFDGDVIRLQVRSFGFETDPKTKEIKEDQMGGGTDIDPQTGQLRLRPAGNFNFDSWGINTHWSNPNGEYVPYNGPVAPPQVAYRIDKQRFFEIVPHRQYPCDEARLYYNDTAKGIRTNVMDARYGRGTFIIDAANDQYLVAPILPSSSGCQSGGSDMCADRLYYSKDAGRTWQVNKPEWSGSNVYITGDQIYAGGRASIHDLRDGFVDGIWTRVSPKNFPQPRKAPLDTEFHCNSNEKE